MDGSCLSPFPHHSWLGFRVEAGPGPLPLCVHMHGVVHTVSLTVAGRHAIRRIGGGRETRWTEDCGTVHFIPADGEQRTFVTTPEPRFASEVLVIPQRHLDGCLASEGLDPPGEARRILAPDDPVLRSCMHTVTARFGQHDDIRRDEAARLLVLRLTELGGGRRPDWHADSSTFDRRTLARFVAEIDAHLRLAPSLAGLAQGIGLSPSHFAKKFRASTGLSLHRFINRRRLRAALDALRSGQTPLAQLALDLGFASQSHFTRLFSDLTGMTPARYRRQFAPTVG